MPIDLIVQNDEGTVANAEAYVDLVTYKDYCARRGRDLDNYDDDQLSISLIEACDYMDTRWRYKGEKKVVDQSTQFPRINLYNRDGYLVHGVPTEVKRAQMEYGYIALTSTLNPSPSRDETGARIIQMSESVGPISESKTFASGASIQDPVYPIADNILKTAGFVVYGNSLIRG